MEQGIVGYHKDEEGHWVAKLSCGHFQHVRHKPPWFNRPWVLSAERRASMIGLQLQCKKCDAGSPKDEFEL